MVMAEFYPAIWIRAVGVCCLLAFVSPVAAVERTLEITAPKKVAANSALTAVISAGTDAGQGERIGFFQVEQSRDDGRTWQPVRYLDNIGASTTQTIDLTAGPAGSELRLRVRVAFRDGLAGDVDYRGAAIRWTETWGKWREPPAKSAVITVVGE